MENIPQHKAEQVAAILKAGKDLVLASIRPDGTPHASTMNYASDGMRIYCAISLDSQKAHDIRHDGRVAYAVSCPYAAWSEIRGLSVDATAVMLSEPHEMRLASTLLLQKFPQFLDIVSDAAALPWPGMLFISLRPKSLSLLDYAQGYGHTEYFAVD